jgi:uncharacterized protein
MTADEVANFLHNHPDFFIDHAELLAELKFSNTHGASAVSLVERQALLLREKVKLLEGKLGELIGFGEENDIIAEKVHRLAVDLQSAKNLFRAVVELHSHLSEAFTVPCVAVRLWGIDSGDAESAEEFQPVSDTIKHIAGSLMQPYCGPADSQESVVWFGERDTPLRPAGSRQRRYPSLPSRHGHALPFSHWRSCCGNLIASRQLNV